MGYSNPPIPWATFEGRLTGRVAPERRMLATPAGTAGRGGGAGLPQGAGVCGAAVGGAAGGSAGSVCRAACAQSHFSFLDGASAPERLVEEAVRLGLDGLALTDHDGFYGAPVFAEAAAELDLATIYGAELSVGLPGPQAGVADPDGDHLLVLAGGLSGYRRLAGVITEGHLAGGEKNRPRFDLEDLAAAGGGEWTVLTGCRKGIVRRALADHGPDAAEAAIDRLVGLFGAGRVVVELIDHQLPTDTDTNDTLMAIAGRRGLRVVASGNVHYARPGEARLAAAMAAVRARRSLAELDGWLPPPTQFLRSGAEMAARFARYPGVVAATVDVAREVAFDLQKARPRLPKLDVPDGHTPDSYLAELARAGVDRLYLDPAAHAAALVRLGQELELIRVKDFAGYFLIVHEIVGVREEPGHSVPGPGIRRRIAGVLRDRRDRDRCDAVPVAVRTVPVDDPR